MPLIWLLAWGLGHWGARLVQSQVWEKPISPGLVYRMEVDPSVPRVIHALRFTPGSPVRAVAQLAGHTVYESTPTKGRATVGEIARSEGALAGINADFFPYTGDPLGTMIVNGDVLSAPTLPRACFGWANSTGEGIFGIATFHGTIRLPDGEAGIDNVNADCGQNQIVVDTEGAGLALGKAPNVFIRARLETKDFTPDGTSTATVVDIRSDETSTPVAGREVVLVASGNKIGKLSSLRRGDQVRIRLAMGGFDWKRVDQMVGGGPFLLRDGAVALDGEAEKFKEDLIKQRHPRSAVGRTSEGDIWFVAVDGRQKISQGATLVELTEIMRRLGCRDAINLDGGGSTDMNLLGFPINRPSDLVERPVANAILFLGPRSETSVAKAQIEGKPAFEKEQQLTATLDAKPVDDSDVIWSAQGAAWVDQAGVLHALQPGVATVVAWVKGKTVSRQFTVVAPKTG